MIRILTAAAALGLAATAAQAADSLQSVKYACKGNEQLHVVYVNTAAGNSYAILSQMDELIPMKQMKMASGASYKAIDKNYTYVLDTKGNEATLSDQSGEILSDCNS